MSGSEIILACLAGGLFSVWMLSVIWPPKPRNRYVRRWF